MYLNVTASQSVVTSELNDEDEEDDDDDDADDDVMLQSLSREPAIINLLKQQYDIDVNIRSLKSFMVFRLILLYSVYCVTLL